MNQKKLSIVVPAYNMENYIARCLDSIFISQEPEERYEVIVVNDGSKDKTKDIVNEYLPKHQNLTLISQENQGLSAARNAGLERITGDYVWFVDSDDAVTEKTDSILGSPEKADSTREALTPPEEELPDTVFKLEEYFQLHRGNNYAEGATLYGDYLFQASLNSELHIYNFEEKVGRKRAL